MIEEAKAQREIEEKKKKIEKDLQQHIGEVNRLMKYWQKAQVDPEKQLYMDKIKELETMLHRHFANNAVNKVNPRKEFYNVEIEKVVKKNYNKAVTFTKIPAASEYRQSVNIASRGAF